MVALLKPGVPDGNLVGEGGARMPSPRAQRRAGHSGFWLRPGTQAPDRQSCGSCDTSMTSYTHPGCLEGTRLQSRELGLHGSSTLVLL